MSIVPSGDHVAVEQIAWPANSSGSGQFPSGCAKTVRASGRPASTSAVSTTVAQQPEMWLPSGDQAGQNASEVSWSLPAATSYSRV
jgi:hypothetical protein